MKLLEQAISRARATVSILLFVLIAGVVARYLISVDLNPDVTVPVVMVTVTHQGISPEDANRLLIKPLEIELKSLDGVEELTTRAQEGSAYAVVEFEIDIDISAALADVREAVNRAKAEFPNDTDEPIVNELSASPEPTLVIAFSGEQLTERELFHIVRDLRLEIESLPEILEANLSGDREEVVEVLLNSSALEHYNITADELLKTVAANNLLVPSGEYDTASGRFGVKVPGLIEGREDLMGLPVKSNAEGVVTLADVADVRRTFKDPATFSHINGRQAMAIEVFKRNQANAIKSVASVKALVEGSADTLPRGVQIDYIFDASDFALQMVNELQGNILTAVALVMVVVVAALGLRSGLLVSLGIPFSLFGATIVVYLLGYSFNFMVIFGLLLALGMLIDGAIVVVEYADQKTLSGLSLRDAYVTAVRRMFMPVVASTATTLAVFLPLMLWPGVVGEFMSYLPVTVFAVLSWSLFYALLFVPVLGVLFGRKKDQSAPATDIPVRGKAYLGKLGTAYGKFIGWALAQPVLTIVSVLLLLVTIFVLYGTFGRGVDFFVETEDRYGIVSVQAQGNLTIADMARLSREVELRVMAVPHVKTVYAASRGSSIGGNLERAKDQISNILVELGRASDRDRTSREVYADVRRAVAGMAGIDVTVNPVQGGPPVGKDIQLQLSSSNRGIMREEARRIRYYLENQMTGLRDVEDTLPLPGIEWELVVDRAEAAMLGVDTLQVGNMVQLVTNGIKIGEFRPDDAEEEVEIRVRYPAADRGLFALDELRVTTPSGAVPVSTFVERKPRPRLDSIQRIDRSDVLFVKANAEDGVLPDDKVKEIAAWLKTADINPAVKIAFRGANEEQEDSIAFLGVAFLMALFLMLILMVMQFNSFYQAFLILSAVVMSTAGVLLGLLVMQQPLSVLMSGIGIVALAGIVVNNNIVLIDTYNHLRREDSHLSALDAAVSSAITRLRPVLLTTVTTAVGLLPLACSVSLDFIHRQIEVNGELASWWQQLAAAIVNGLLFSTILTLVFTPAMLVLPEFLRVRVMPRLSGVPTQQSD
ncbi:MAG: efflux RND transporter permease subunit [Porticoccus sp.]|jgi:multidrug efflux pump|uniref:efflux RND transporter permease subunit n=1 Tax=Porticoccus sp. TaxID=2024853 RepID=UPI0032978472